jgi:Uma2 family endonuclease/predicted transcriptional regulator
MALAPDSSGERQWTVSEYMALEDEERHELIHGELLMVPSPNTAHQRTITKFGTLIDTHVLENDLGECFDAPFDVVLAEDTVLQPDFTFVSKERFPELWDGHCITGAPDMVVEVVSPSTAQRDRISKRRIFAESGVPWVLFVDPDAHFVEVFHLNDAGKYVLENSAAEDETLGFGLFPDLEIELSKIWFHPPEAEANGAEDAMATAKQDIRQLLDKLPEDSTYEDIQYHIYVRQKVAKGLEDVEEGRVLSQDEVQERMGRWLDD